MRAYKSPFRRSLAFLVSPPREPPLFGLLQAGTNVLWHNPRQTAADWSHNDQVVTGLVEYASARLS